MEKPSASDDSFKAFMEKIQTQNQRGFITQLLQVKAEREIAGEDNDKREEQLSDIISSLKEVRLAVTGIKLDIDLTPLVNIGENQTKLLEELSKEASLTRKLTEGSVEYDKEAAQYRNTSGRDIESKVSGKTSKDGGFLDFETARDTLSGQGKRAKEANAFSLKPISYTPGKTVAGAVGGRGSKATGNEEEEPAKEKDTRGFFKTFKDEVKATPGRIRDNLIGYTPEDRDRKKRKTEVDGAEVEPNATEPVTRPVTAKPQITGVNPESDNVRDSAEIAADYEKEDIELSKQMLGVMREQLISLKTIQEALAPNIPAGPNKSSGAKSPGSKEAAGEVVGGGGGDGGGVDLLDALPGKGALKRAGGAVLKGAKTVGKGALSLGGGVAKFAGSGAGKLLGATAAVGMGAYTAYTGVTEAEDSKQAKLEEVQAKVESGELKPEEAAAQRKEIGNSATVEKSGAVGEGSGMAAGAIAGGMAGAKLGAAIGSIIPGAGTVVGAGIGTIAGGALGAFAGSSAGKYVGEKVGSGINAVKDFFGGPGSKAEAAKAAAPATPKALSAHQMLAQRDVARTKAKADQVAPTGNGSGTLQAGSVMADPIPEAKPTETVAGGPGSKAEAGKTKYMVNGQPATKEEHDAAQKDIAKMQQDIKENPMLALRAGRPDLIPAKGDMPAGTGKEATPIEAIIGDLPAYGDGGIANKPQVALVGEKGPEAIIPMKDGAVPVETIAGDKKSSENESPLGDYSIPDIPKLPALDGDLVQDSFTNRNGTKIYSLRGGTSVEVNKDGTKTYSGAFGTFTYDKAGKAIKYAIPSAFGVSKSIDLTTNEVTEGYASGPLRLSQTTDAKGKKTSTSAEYNFGAARARRETDAEGKNTNTAFVPVEAETHVVPMNSEADREQFSAAMQTQNRAALPGTIIPSAPTRSGQEVTKTTTENTDMEREASRGEGNNNTIVSNNVNNNNTTKFVPMKPTARPEYTGSALDRHANRISVY